MELKFHAQVILPLPLPLAVPLPLLLLFIRTHIRNHTVTGRVITIIHAYSDFLGVWEGYFYLGWESLGDCWEGGWSCWGGSGGKWRVQRVAPSYLEDVMVGVVRVKARKTANAEKVLLFSETQPKTTVCSLFGKIFQALLVFGAGPGPFSGVKLDLGVDVC